MPQRESFVRGALMLAVAALVSRLLGALYKPIIARIFAPYDGHMGAVGIGLTQVPLTAYMIILSFTSVGLNVGISRLVAERVALGDTAGARRVFRLSLTLMASLGLVASVAMWVGAPWIARLISPDITDTIPGFRATAPALFFVSVMAAYRGLFQGFQYMLPNAYSQIIEQVVRVGAGVLLTYVLVRQSVPLGAAGFNFGDVIGGLAGLLYLLYLVSRAGPALWASGPVAATAERAAAPALEGGWTLLRRIFGVAGPITIVGAVVPLMMLADTFFVFRTLGALRVDPTQIKAQYGMLTNAFMIVSLPAVFTTALYTSVLPSITEAITLGNQAAARHKAAVAYRLTGVLAFPAQAGLMALATGLYALLYGDTSGGPVMAAMAWATLAIMTQQTTSGVLQGVGHIGLPVANFVVGALLKVILTAWWTPIWGINGAAFATAAGFALAAVLNLVYVERLLGPTFQVRDMLIKPLGAALLMFLTLRLAAPWLRAAWPGHGATLLLVALGGLVYGLALLLSGGVREADLERLPKLGRPLVAWLRGVRLLR